MEQKMSAIRKTFMYNILPGRRSWADLKHGFSHTAEEDQVIDVKYAESAHIKYCDKYFSKIFR